MDGAMSVIINGTTGISGVDGSASTPAVQGTDTNTGVFFGTDTVTIATGGTAAVTVDSGQRTKFPTTIGVGNATPSTSGSGISFPASQSASTDANTLDDYEEGTWTPGFAFGGNAVGVTYTAGNSGIYTKIGRVVTVIANVALTNKGSSTGNATITGLPFTAATGAEPNYSAVSFGNVSFLTFVEVPVGTVGGGETVIYLREITSAGGGTALTNADFDNQTQTRITVSYFVS